MKNFLKKIILLSIFIAVFGSFIFIAKTLAQLNDPQKQLETLLLNCDKTITKAFFSPDDDVKSLLIKLIDAEKKRVITAIYTITDKDVSQALIDAHERGIIVELVVDRGYGSDRYSRVPQIANAKIPIWVYQTSEDEKCSSLMHNKFCIFEDNICDKTIIWTGSYNFTNRANLRNQENVIILDNKSIIDQFLKQFEKLKTRSLLISGRPGTVYTPQEQHTASWWQKILTNLGI